MWFVYVAISSLPSPVPHRTTEKCVNPNYLKQWPAPGYRQQDFPKTEAIIHNFLALPIGVKYTDEDADYIAAAIKQVHGELIT